MAFILPNTLLMPGNSEKTEFRENEVRVLFPKKQLAQLRESAVTLDTSEANLLIQLVAED